MSWIATAWCWIKDNAAALSALATFAAVVVAAVYAWLTRKLWIATRSQAERTREIVDLTKKMFEADHRPWLAVDVTWETAYQTLAFSLTNYGAAPAIVMDWHVSVTEGGAEIATAERPSPTMSYIFPTRSEFRPAISFDTERTRWDRQGVVVQVRATVRYRGTQAAGYSTSITALIPYGGKIQISHVDVV